MPDQELLVRIVGDDRALQAAFTRSTRATQKFGAEMEAANLRTSRLGQGVRGALSNTGGAGGFLFGSSAFVGAAIATAGIKKSIDAASDLNEQLSRTQVILGDASGATIEWSKTTARSMGISQRAALAATSTFAGLFQTVGVQQARAGELSQSLVKLAADLASLQNSSPEEALVALRSGLAGEAEPLRRFNIFLTEARVQQEALTESGKKSATQLTAQEKTLARYNLILKDSASAQGNFALTSGGLANQQRILAAQTDDLATKIGGVLIPQVTTLASNLNDAFEFAAQLTGALQDLGSLPGIEIPVKFVFDDNGSFLRDLLGKTNFSQARDFLTLLRQGDLVHFGESPSQTLANQRRQAAVSAAVDRSREGHEQPGAAAAQQVADDQARRARRDLERSRRRFAAFTAGLGLKLKNAGLTDSLNDDLAVMQEIEDAIKRQIAKEGRTFKLANDLADIQIQIANTRAAQADRVAAAEDAADQRAASARDRRRSRLQAAQFEAIGLTAQGDRRVPGIGALRNRARSLLRQISGTDLDTSRNRDRIGAVLSEQFKNAGREVRDAILSMFNEISAALDQGSKETQTHTKFRVVNTSNILSGLGLSEDETQKLRRRLSRLGPNGTTPRDGRAGGAFGFDVGPGGNTIVTGPVTVVANDPEEFGRKLERNRRRGAKSRTGRGN